MTTVSVIITTHNRPQRLSQAVASARMAGGDVEIIVVDDASSDDTARVCREIENIRYVRVDCNQQVAGARNIGLLASRGKYITFLDDDDVRLPGSLDQQVEMLECNPHAALVYGQAIPEGENGERGAAFPENCPAGDIFWELLTRNFIPCGSVVFRRAYLARIGLLDHAIAGIDDWDLWLRLTELFPAISLSSPVLVWRRSNPDSRQGSSDTISVINLSITHFRSRCLRMQRTSEASRRERRLAWRKFSINIAEHLAWETFRELLAGRPRRAFASARTLLRLHPSALVHLSRRWARASTLKVLATNRFAGNDLRAAKDEFKEIRSVPDNL